MAGCGGRRPNMEEEADGRSVEMPPVPAAHRGPENLADRSATNIKENPEYSPEKTPTRKRTIFSEVQLNTLEAVFRQKQYMTLPEREQLGNHLSLTQRQITIWFQNRRNRERNRALNFQHDPEWVFPWYSKPYTLAHHDLQHRQRMESTMKCMQAQKRLYLDRFPPLWPMYSYGLPWGQHSFDRIYNQNVGGSPYRLYGTEHYKMHNESGHRPPYDFHLNLCQPNKTIKPGTSIWPHGSSITNDLTSYDRPSTSSAPSPSQMPIAPYNFNLPRTSIWNPASSITTDLTSKDGPSTSSAPSTSQMPIALGNADDGSSTDCSLVIDEGCSTDCSLVIDERGSTDCSLVIDEEAVNSD